MQICNSIFVNRVYCCYHCCWCYYYYYMVTELCLEALGDILFSEYFLNLLLAFIGFWVFAFLMFMSGTTQPYFCLLMHAFRSLLWFQTCVSFLFFIMCVDAGLLLVVICLSHVYWRMLILWIEWNAFTLSSHMVKA